MDIFFKTFTYPFMLSQQQKNPYFSRMILLASKIYQVLYLSGHMERLSGLS